MFGSSSQETGQLAPDNRRMSSSDTTSPRHMGNSEQATDDTVVNMMRSIRAATACGGIGITIGMLFSIMTNLVSFDITGLILSLYLAPIGCIIFIVEWEKLFYDPVVKYFPFLKHHTGRAAFYLFVAAQCLALGGISGYILGAAFLVFSVVGFFFHLTHGKPANNGMEELQEVDVQVVQPAVTPEVRTEPFPGEQRAAPGSKSLADANSSFGAAVGGAALDWAVQNPENAQVAASFAFQQAKENPEMAKSVAKAMV